MNDVNEYVNCWRHYYWFPNLPISPGATTFSPIFSIDRESEVLTTDIRTADDVDAPRDMVHTVPIGTRVLMGCKESDGAIITGLAVTLFASCTKDSGLMFPVLSVTCPSGGIVISDSVQPWPYIQFAIENADSEAEATICGAFRVLPH